MANEIYKNYGSINKVLTQTIPVANVINTNSTWTSAAINAGFGPSGSVVPRIVSISSNAISAAGQFWLTNIPLGAVITAISIDYVLAGSRSRTPTYRLGLNLVRFPFSGVEASLFSTGFQQLPIYSTLASNSGTANFTVDQNNTITTGFVYYIVLVEETGIAGNNVYSFNVSYIPPSTT